jgi:hypothetical protein
MSSTKLPIGAERSYYGGVRTIVPVVIAPVVIVANSVVIFWSDIGLRSLPGILLVGIFPVITVLMFRPAGLKGARGKLDAQTAARQALILRWYTVVVLAAALVVVLASQNLPAIAYLAFVAALTGWSAYHFNRIDRAIGTQAQEDKSSQTEEI